MTQAIAPPPPHEEEIDLRELFFALWEMKFPIAGCSLLGLALAAFYAFVVAEPSYESSALLLPTQSVTMDQLGAAASLFGKKPTSNADVELYQSLLTSRTVMHKLLRSDIEAPAAVPGAPASQAPVRPLLGLLGIDSNDAKAMDAAIKSLSQSVGVDAKESGESGILEVRFSAPSPWLAQKIGNKVLEIGQEELRLVRIARSEMITARLRVAVSQARAEWDSTSQALTWYKAKNRSIQTPEQFLELSRLEIEKSAKEQKYLIALKEYEVQMLEIAKAAPPMIVLDPANLPSRKSKPLRSLILAGGLVFSFLGACAGGLAWRFLLRRTTS